jgi:hypothetical protein
VFIQEDKDFMLEVYDFAIKALGDKLFEEDLALKKDFNRAQRIK